MLKKKEEIIWRQRTKAILPNYRSPTIKDLVNHLNQAQTLRKDQRSFPICQTCKCQRSNSAENKNVNKYLITRETNPYVLYGLEYIDFDPNFTLVNKYRSGQMNRLGLDIGTKNIVLAYKDNDNKRKIRHEVNGFLKIPKVDGFTKQLLINSGVAYIEDENNFIALGRKAEELSYAFNKTLERPMVDGVISGKTEESIKIMAIIIRAIIGKITENTILYYCIPGEAINSDINTKFHDKVVKIMIDELNINSVRSYSINEARAIVIGQIEDKTGIGISFGAGMVNVSYCLYGIEIFSFSIVGSGDRIDIESAKRFGYNPKEPEGNYKETPTSICRRKEKMSLSECPSDMVGKTIWINYGIMIENVAKEIINGFKKHEERARIDKPIPIIMAGGTTSPDGFVEYVENVIKKLDIPFEIGTIKRADRPLYAVAEGCLLAAEMHEANEQK